MPGIRDNEQEPREEKIGVKPPQGISSKLLIDYLNNCSKGLLSLKDAAKRSDFGQTQVLGHRFRGTGGAYGIPVLSQIGSLIEAASSHRDIIELQHQIADLEQYLRRIEVVSN